MRMVIRRDVVEEVDNPYTRSPSRTPAAPVAPMGLGRRGLQRDPHQELRLHRRLRLPGRSSFRASARPSAARCTTPSPKRPKRAHERRGQPHRRSPTGALIYVVEVRRTARGTQVVISRTHYGLVRRLFEMEVPEIFDGVVEIRSIAREAGSRTKMAVWSNDPDVDPIGACVGTRGQRVNTIVEELGGEKVDIIKYSDDPGEYVAAALAPRRRGER